MICIKRVILLCSFISILNCKNDTHLTKIEGQRISISDSITNDSEIEAYIKPYRDNVNRNLDSVVSYAKDTYSKSDGHLNTAIGNFMADAVFEECNPIFKSRTNHDIDMVLLNHGGIRSIISKGNLTIRTAYEVMPFENSVIIAALKGEQINQLIQYLANEKRAHPISQLELVLNEDFTVKSALIKGKPIIKDNVYYVATNDYLYNGADGMTFFKPNEGEYDLNYKIRNVLIDYFKKNDTISPTIDNRFIQINN